MHKEKIAIIGAGILGRSLAYRLSQEGFAVTVFEKNAETDETASSFVAGGMLAPYCEVEYSPEDIVQPGLKSIAILKEWHQAMNGEFWFRNKGSLVVHHLRDRSELLRLQNRLDTLGYQSAYEIRKNGLFFREEAHVHTNSLLHCLTQYGKNSGVEYKFNCPIASTEDISKNFSWTFNCSGIAAKTDIQNLRGVRGEVAEIQTKEVQLEHPVRLMHPRYPVYIIPRPDHRFVIGATVVESEKLDNVTVRSALELLSAAATVDPAFAEANILALRTQVRPAFPDHLPHIQVKHQTVYLNGLYRHGYLFTPYIVESVVQKLIQNEIKDQLCSKLF